MRSETLCAVHKHGRHVPIERHHIWPLGYHGPNTAENKIAICSNAHSDVHYLLELLLRGPVPWSERRTYGYKTAQVADRGYQAILAYSKGVS